MARGKMHLSSRRSTKFTKKDDAIVKKAVATVNKTIETKHYVQSGLSTNIDFNGALSNLSAVPTTAGNRVGDQIDPSYLRIRGEIIVGSTTNMVRVMLIRWKVSNATPPVPADILDDNGFWIGNARAPLSTLRFEKNARAKFNKLYDKLFHLHQSKQNVLFDIKDKCAGQLKYDSGAVTGTGQYYLFVISDDGAVVYPSFSWVSELTYRDA